MTEEQKRKKIRNMIDEDLAKREAQEPEHEPEQEPVEIEDFNENEVVTSSFDLPPTPAPVEEKLEKDVSFPSNAFEGTIFGDYETAFAGKNETCPAFRFSELAVAMGGLFGRRIYLKHGNNYLFPNMFTALVGRSVFARKSASISASKFLIREHECETMKKSVSINSAEGLIAQLAEVEGTRLICYINELRQLFIKASQKTTENIFPKLNEAFDGDTPMQVNTKKDTLEAIRPSISLMGCLTLNWFQDSVTLSGISGGFINRIAFFMHEQMPLKSRSEIGVPAVREFSKVKNTLEEIAALQTPTQFFYDDDCKARETEYYHAKMSEMVEANDDILTDARTRTLLHLEKIALMLAWTENSRQDNHIHICEWERARQFAEYLETVNLRLFRDITFDALTAQEQRVLKALEALGNTATKTELSNKIGRQLLSSRDLARITDALVSNEVVCVTAEGRSTRITRIA